MRYYIDALNTLTEPHRYEHSVASFETLEACEEWIDSQVYEKEGGVYYEYLVTDRDSGQVVAKRGFREFMTKRFGD